MHLWEGFGGSGGPGVGPNEGFEGFPSHPRQPDGRPASRELAQERFPEILLSKLGNFERGLDLEGLELEGSEPGDSPKTCIFFVFIEFL